MSSKTMVVKQSQVRHDWFVVDAQGTAVGRIAARAAKILMGKNKAAWSHSLDNGEYVFAPPC